MGLSTGTKIYLFANAVVLFGTAYASLPKEGSIMNPGYKSPLETIPGAFETGAYATLAFNIICGVAYAIKECCAGSFTQASSGNHQVTHFKANTESKVSTKPVDESKLSLQ